MREDINLVIPWSQGDRLPRPKEDTVTPIIDVADEVPHQQNAPMW